MNCLAPIRSLECCCCGSATKGRQWHNRDTGYGLCVACAEWMIAEKRDNPKELAGERGVHWDVSQGV